MLIKKLKIKMRFKDSKIIKRLFFLKFSMTQHCKGVRTSQQIRALVADLGLKSASGFTEGTEF